ncbi:MAG: class I SAM-dependent methyltransferase [Pseudomonadota bacterium]
MNSDPQKYYDEFSSTYEFPRHHGYHRLLDDLELSVAKRYCKGELLDAGCGTGLILERLVPQVKRALGVDLSSGMLSLAQGKGLHVFQSSVDALPFPNDFFDTVVSFKVLAHVPSIQKTLGEMARVTRPGGRLVLEFYNRKSLRYLIKRLKYPNRIGSNYTDEDVYTRFDTVDEICGYLPPTLNLICTHGVRVFTPAAQVHDFPMLRNLFGVAERYVADTSFFRRFAGFLIVVLGKA